MNAGSFCNVNYLSSLSKGSEPRWRDGTWATNAFDFQKAPQSFLEKLSYNAASCQDFREAAEYPLVPQ